MTRIILYKSLRIAGMVIILAQAASCVTLDEAYDKGGAGGGRTIETDAGPVQLTGPDGLVVESSAEVGELTITGGADIAEPFSMADSVPVFPGQVVVIDETNPGLLRVSDHAYDTRVAGVIAGAGELSPGLKLTGMTPAEEGFDVALTGVVYVWADTSMGAIQPGDLLTTSDNRGHAMKVTDHEKAQGAVLGKALGSLNQGKGLVLMLVSLL